MFKNAGGQRGQTLKLTPVRGRGPGIRKARGEKSPVQYLTLKKRRKLRGYGGGRLKGWKKYRWRSCCR